MADETEEKPNEESEQEPVKTTAELVKAEDAPSWDAVLVKAAPEVEQVPGSGASNGGQPTNKHAQWIRASLPLVILFFYVLFKIFSGGGDGDKAAAEVEETASLTGKKVSEPKIRLSGDVEALAVEMESLLTKERYRDALRVYRQADEEVRTHPVTRALAAIVSVEILVYRSDANLYRQRGAIKSEIEELQAVFKEDRKRQALYDYLLIAEAEIQLDLVQDADSAVHRAKTIRRLIRRIGSNTERAIDLRLRYAEKYESAGDEMAEAADRLIGVDEEEMRIARNLYQDALRGTATVDGWDRLQPVSDDARFIQTRVLEKIRVANRGIAGRAGTWTGEANDPVHRFPGGAW